MFFIEQLFGISPDGGNGATELLFVSGILICIVAGAVWRARVRFAKLSDAAAGAAPPPGPGSQFVSQNRTGPD